MNTDIFKVIHPYEGTQDKQGSHEIKDSGMNVLIRTEFIVGVFA
jgi:hypothetical protein